MCPNRLLPCLSLLSALVLFYSVSASTAHQDMLAGTASRVKYGQHVIAHHSDYIDSIGNNNGVVPINGRPMVAAQSNCEWMKVPMCSGVGYNYTIMPNVMGHETQGEALEALQLISNLLDHQCSPFLRLYVCSVFFPFCSEHLSSSLPPCARLCEDVKKDCSPVLLEIGFSWPEQLNCSGLPNAPDLCMQPPQDGGLEPTDIQIKRQFLTRQPLLLEPLTLQTVPSRKCPTNTILSGNSCLTICGSQSPDYTVENRFAAELWIAIWSTITMVLSIFSMLTFVLQPKRFRWPARPILYLTSCGAASSSVALIRWIAGPYTCSGDSMVLNRSYDSCICIGSALLVTYFDIAFANWWLVFAYVWYLSAAREWSTEAIERISTRLHHYVWTSSLLPIIYALLANAISFNTITGFCQLDSRLLTEITLAIVVLGAILSILTTRALHRVKLTLLYSGSRPFKLDRLIYRLCVISFGVCVSLLVALSARLLSTVTQSNPQQQQQQEHLSATNKLTTELVRIGAFCASVCFASLWIISAKTFRTWNNALILLTCKGSGGCSSWLLENKGQQNIQQQAQAQQRLSLRPPVLVGASTKV